MSSTSVISAFGASATARPSASRNSAVEPLPSVVPSRSRVGASLTGVTVIETVAVLLVRLLSFAWNLKVSGVAAVLL